jgi:hypothetical protein
MVVDLNRILRYGKPNKSLSDKPQKVLHSITDAIICGYGDGALHSKAIFAGLITCRRILAMPNLSIEEY